MKPWPGMWISTLVLLPDRLFLTWKAATDSPLFDADAYYRGWERFRSLFGRMRILQLCNKPPYPPIDGGSKAMHNLTQG
jgi:hypothetical protein